MVKNGKTQHSNPGLLGQEHCVSKSWFMAILRYVKFLRYII